MRRPPVPTSTLLAALPVKTVHGALPPTVTGVTYDSRKVVPGDLFVAVPGLKQDGRRYVHDAVGRGASAVVLEGPSPLPAALVAQIVVPSAREALARLADAYYGHPSRALTLVGITGTNGKTTTTFLVDALLRAAGHRTGLIGTIEYRIGDEAMAAGGATPPAPGLQRPRPPPRGGDQSRRPGGPVHGGGARSADPDLRHGPGGGDPSAAGDVRGGGGPGGGGEARRARGKRPAAG